MNRPQLNPPAPAVRILLLPAGEGRDEGRLRSSSLIGSWSQCVSILWKTCLPMNRRMVPFTSPGRGVQTVAHGVSRGASVPNEIRAPEGRSEARVQDRTSCVSLKPTSTRPVLSPLRGSENLSTLHPWLTPWASALWALRASMNPAPVAAGDPLPKANGLLQTKHDLLAQRAHAGVHRREGSRRESFIFGIPSAERRPPRSRPMRPLFRPSVQPRRPPARNCRMRSPNQPLGFNRLETDGLVPTSPRVMAPPRPSAI